MDLHVNHSFQNGLLLALAGIAKPLQSFATPDWPQGAASLR
jgi:hypothetical protein